MFVCFRHLGMGKDSEIQMVQLYLVREEPKMRAVKTRTQFAILLLAHRRAPGFVRASSTIDKSCWTKTKSCCCTCIIHRTAGWSSGCYWSITRDIITLSITPIRPVALLSYGGGADLQQQQDRTEGLHRNAVQNAKKEGRIEKMSASGRRSRDYQAPSLPRGKKSHQAFFYGEIGWEVIDFRYHNFVSTANWKWQTIHAYLDLDPSGSFVWKEYISRRQSIWATPGGCKQCILFSSNCVSYPVLRRLLLAKVSERLIWGAGWNEAL